MIRYLILALAFIAYANGHALMADPPQRGILGGASKFTPGLKVDNGAPADFFAHFPAGDKSTRPGAGKLSQERAADWKWSVFKPMQPGFRWRAGVCGDLKTKPEHLRGGKYYFGGKVTRTFPQGGVIEVRQAVVAHHNGYVELHVCNVRECGGEISESCFRNGHCSPLPRAANPECDSGMSKNCGPIDRNNPTRWYLPCSKQVNDEGWDDYLGRYAKFRLPSSLSCDHCVLHWFYTSANGCNPPGVVQYFKGPDRPRNWGNCPGQGGAVGGFTEVQNECGTGRIKDQFPEEYYQCADIRITRSASGGPSPGGSPGTSPTTQPPTTTRPPTTAGTAATTRQPTTARITPPPDPAPNSSSDVFRHFNFIADGRIVQSFTNSLNININSYNQVAIEAVLSRAVKPVDFYIDGRKVWDESTGPFFLYGNRGRVPRYFDNEQLNRVLGRNFRLEVRWQSERMAANVRMFRA